MATKPIRRFDEPPRVLSIHEAAEYLGRSQHWLKDRMAELQAMGFPRPLPVFGGFDRRAIDAFIDRLGGVPDLPDAAGRSNPWDGAADG